MPSMDRESLELAADYVSRHIETLERQLLIAEHKERRAGGRELDHAKLRVDDLLEEQEAYKTLGLLVGQALRRADAPGETGYLRDTSPQYLEPARTPAGLLSTVRRFLPAPK